MVMTAWLHKLFLTLTGQLDFGRLGSLADHSLLHYSVILMFEAMETKKTGRTS